MFAFIHNMADERIRQAEKEGQFKDLEGAGKPLVLEDDSMIPPELRMSYKILKNSGFLPPEMEREKEINRIVDMLAECSDERERLEQMQKLELILTRAEARRGRPISLDKESDYYRRIIEQVKLNKNVE
ncbi:MAG: DnaJ family domain-containing protein [Desulfovibrio sp.]